jgi:hypothetical protein
MIHPRLAVVLVFALPAPALAQEPPPRVHVALFTHIEDNTPAGALDTAMNRQAYLTLRTRLIEMGATAQRLDVPWSLQPDWKVLLAAARYEDEALRQTTAGLNAFRYLRDVLGVRIDPHSHESGGYNYTDVAYLLETLGVGGSTVIGGHVWDPSLPQFAEWDRFREPVRGQQYPSAVWRGDILMGSGTPNHVNDPVVSGIWRPRDRADYFADDPNGNITCVGAFKADLAGIAELVQAYRVAEVPGACLLTSTYHLRPADLGAPGGLAALEANVLLPLVALRDRGEVVLTDFTALVATWREQYGGRACLYGQVPN